MPRTNVDLPVDRIRAFCEQNYIRRLAIFGSALRSDFRPDSDVDLLVEFVPGHTPGLAFFDMETELSSIVGRRVDLNTLGFVSPCFRGEVASEAEVVYEQA